MKKDIILFQSNCGKYDLFIRDMPLGLLYISRMLVEAGYRVHIVDQRVERENTLKKLTELMTLDPLWIGITAMTGEPVFYALEVCKFLKSIPRIGINAGHDLNLKNLGFFLKKIPNIQEVSIGHAIICDAFEFGLQKTIKKYLSIIKNN